MSQTLLNASKSALLILQCAFECPFLEANMSYSAFYNPVRGTDCGEMPSIGLRSSSGGMSSGSTSCAGALRNTLQLTRRLSDSPGRAGLARGDTLLAG